MPDVTKDYLARDLIGTKLSRMLFVIGSFEEELDKTFSLQKQHIEREKAKITGSVNAHQLLRVEAEAARNYWSAIRECLPARWRFTARTRQLRGYS